MGRKALEIGEHGAVKREQIGKDRWRVWTRLRGADGVVRGVERTTPAGTRDTHGAVAERILLADIKDMAAVEGGGRIGANSPMTDLLDIHMQAITAEDSHLARRSVDSYVRVSKVLIPRLGKLKVGEATVRRLSQIITGIQRDHGQVTGKQALTLLRAAGRIAVEEGAWPRNRARDVELGKARRAQPKEPTRALTADELSVLLHRLETSTEPLPPLRNAKREPKRTVSQWARDVDLVDPILLLAGTGLRRSEMLGLLWSDYDEEAGTLSVRHHVVRTAAAGDGEGTILVHEAATKTSGSARVVALPGFVIDMLTRRRKEPHPTSKGTPKVIFPSTTGALRDPDNLNGQWRRIRGALGFGWVASHSFRKSVATILDQAGLSPRVAADTLGHSKVSMTQDKYFGRNTTHQVVAQVLDAAVSRPIKSD